MREIQSVLIIEDDACIAKLLLAVFADEYHAQVLDSAVDAMAVLKKKPVDLVLCDACLPTLNGYSFIQQLRADPITECIPVVIMSGLDDGFGEDYARDVGAADFISKPFTVVEIREVVRKHLAGDGVAASAKIG